ncbi:MAG TPA: glycosyltransferase family 4 protein [Candidatus Saccharimonadales bacterium]|nr:glycosyltransferase family 4 protein [Candidatus Saccharimonadales bacterium]
MRIAIIGPSHPYKGGIPLHTTELAHRLQAAGHEVALFSWKHQYPKLLYPGQQRVSGEPELPLFPNTSEPLSWYDPLSWARLGRRLRQFDVVVMAYFVPQFQGTAGLVMLKAMGKHRRAQVVALCHNVLQHDPHLGDKPITKLFLSRVDRVLVHSQAEADKAQRFTQKPIYIAKMAAHLPASSRMAGQHTTGVQHRLLFFGLIRKYKGVDVLIRALTQVPEVSLIVAGEPRKLEAPLRSLIHELGLEQRVHLRPEYIPAEELPSLFAQADALVLPYRSGTGTQTAAVGFSQGLPVIVSDLPGIADDVTPNVNGLICQPNDVDSLAAAIKRLYEPGVLAQLRRGLPDTTTAADHAWQTYLKALLAQN